mmetsp:Transcript_43883/g.103786  ORF Transcript_43883/g.103786 Transcript_43883/m.103786 type:complete len:219 (-) Transcript_43883:354-1010(-)
MMLCRRLAPHPPARPLAPTSGDGLPPTHLCVPDPSRRRRRHVRAGDPPSSGPRSDGHPPTGRCPRLPSVLLRIDQHTPVHLPRPCVHVHGTHSSPTDRCRLSHHPNSSCPRHGRHWPQIVHRTVDHAPTGRYQSHSSCLAGSHHDTSFHLGTSRSPLHWLHRRPIGPQRYCHLAVSPDRSHLPDSFATRRHRCHHSDSGWYQHLQVCLPHRDRHRCEA